MKKNLLFAALFLTAGQLFSQASKLYIHIVSHNEPTDNLNQPLNYANAKSKALQMAGIADSKNVKWNLQTSDGFVFGARQDEQSTGTNIFETLASAPYNDNIAIDPRNKNFSGRNIADQWYLLDSLGGNPTETVGGFLWYICQPSSMQPDWWQYQDTITGLVYGNKVKFNILSGAGSAGATLHCNDLNDFGIFKPDTVDNFYDHNPARSLWCVGVGCAPVLDSLNDEQAIIDMIQGQVDSIQNGLWPSDKFYVTRIMTNQREYGPLFFQKISKVIDSLKLIPDTLLKWATIEETLADFQTWQISSGLDSSMWPCGHAATGITESVKQNFFRIYPNPSRGTYSIAFNDELYHQLLICNNMGTLVRSKKIKQNDSIDLSALPGGIYFIIVDGKVSEKLIRE